MSSEAILGIWLAGLVVFSVLYGAISKTFQPEIGFFVLLWPVFSLVAIPIGAFAGLWWIGQRIARRFK